jgi:hypothetical protein
VYRYREPIALPEGDGLDAASLRQLPANRRNRIVRRNTFAGAEQRRRDGRPLDSSRRELDADRRVLEADFGPKVLAEDAIGYEKLLRAIRNARLHDAAAAIFLSLHQYDLHGHI